jgi:DNA-binding MarR family transcriptional regulator
LGSTATEALERLFELSTTLSGLMERGLVDRHLTQARAEVLWRLAHQGAMTQRALSELLKCTPRNVTGLVDSLEADGLVTRNPHPTDRRATLVTLTEQGQAATTALHTEAQEFAESLFAQTSAADMATFLTMLDHVLTALHKAADASSNTPSSSG